MRTFILTILLSVVLVAQGPKSVTRPIDEVDQAPRLTEVESLRLQVIGLQQQITSMSVALETCHIEAAHPGYKLDPQKGLVKR